LTSHVSPKRKADTPATCVNSPLPRPDIPIHRNKFPGSYRLLIFANLTNTVLLGSQEDAVLAFKSAQFLNVTE
jgi:hypothetical protein